MTSQGTPHGRFTRAIKARSLFQAQIALREMRDPPLDLALDYLALLAEVKPERSSCFGRCLGKCKAPRKGR